MLTPRLRWVLASLGAGVVTALLLVATLGPGRTCDLTPPCPPADPRSSIPQACLAIKIVGRCPLTGSVLAVAAISGVAAGAALLIAGRWRLGRARVRGGSG